LEFGQKGKLFYLTLYIAMPSLAIFRHQMRDVLHFQTWSIWAKLENHLELEAIGKVFGKKRKEKRSWAQRASTV
jgi:hypothetical protein